MLDKIQQKICIKVFMMAKKKKVSGPKRKRMSREGRLQSGKEWLKKFDGKNIIKGYVKWFSVSYLCAIIELRMLGVKIDDERLDEAKKVEENKAKQNTIKKKKRQDEYAKLSDDSDENFSFIVGYTSGGAPYGVAWTEVESK